jgi:hypothetical protein
MPPAAIRAPKRRARAPKTQTLLATSIIDAAAEARVSAIHCAATAKPRDDGSTPPLDLAIPVFGYQNHISIKRGFGFIRRWSATDAGAYEGA